MSSCVEPRGRTKIHSYERFACIHGGYTPLATKRPIPIQTVMALLRGNLEGHHRRKLRRFQRIISMKGSNVNMSITWWGKFSEVAVAPIFGKHILMSTAIFLTYTSYGFVIAADGRSVSEDTLEVTNDDVQKIFPVDGSNGNLAYAMTGALTVTSDAGDVVVHIAEEAKKAVHSLARRKTKNLVGYVARLCGPIHQKLRTAKNTGAVSHFPKNTTPQQRMGEVGGTIVRIIVAGFHDGVPSIVEAS
jgi:hypothetical protein